MNRFVPRKTFLDFADARSRRVSPVRGWCSVAVAVLAALPSLTGVAVARLRCRSWTASITVAGGVLIAAPAVVAIKAAAGH